MFGKKTGKKAGLIALAILSVKNKTVRSIAAGVAAGAAAYSIVRALSTRKNKTGKLISRLAGK